MINWLKNEADKLREMIQGRRQLFAYLMFVGFICHGYMFLNKLPNFDDTVALTSKGTTLAAGRWFLPFTTIITNGISIPLFIGIFSITCIIISCFIVCDLLGITKGINIFAAGCLMICFPTITGTFTFMYTTDSYMLGLLFAALAVWIVVKTEKFVPILGGAVASFLLAFSLGSYQAYYNFAWTLALLVMMKIYLYENKETFLHSIIRFFCIMLTALALYMIINKCALYYKNIIYLTPSVKELIYNVPMAIIRSYKEVTTLYIRDFCGVSYSILLRVVYIISLVITFGCYEHTVIKRNKNIFWGNILFFILPLALNFINFAMITRENDTLMIYSYVFLLIMPLMFIEEYRDFSFKMQKLMQGIVLVFAFAAVWQYQIQSNRAYLAMDLAKQQALSYYTTLITQIKSIDGYDDSYPIAIIGKESNDITAPNIDLYTGNIRGTMTLQRYINMYSRYDFMKYYCGFSPEWYSETDKLKSIYEIEEMPCYPKEGSICLLDGIIVVKINEEK